MRAIESLELVFNALERLELGTVLGTAVGAASEDLVTDSWVDFICRVISAFSRDLRLGSQECFLRLLLLSLVV